MGPDVEELIQKVNSLTVDKNRLRQKLSQLTSAQQQPASPPSTSSSSSSLPTLQSNNGQQQQQQQPSSIETLDVSSPKSGIKNPLTSTSPIGSNVIAGVECSSSCQEDLLFVNELFKRRFDEYNENWTLLQSKCSALLSELNALQKHYAILKKEKLEIEESYRLKCDDVDKINCELQTVVLNYETQLSAMSEHLTMITSQVDPDS